MRFSWLPLALTSLLLPAPPPASWADPAFVNGLTIAGDTLDATRKPGANAGRRRWLSFRKWRETRQRKERISALLSAGVLLMTLEAAAQEMCSVGHEHDEGEETLHSLREAARIPVSWHALPATLQQVRAHEEGGHTFDVNPFAQGGRLAPL